jgi:hypothetical protein
MLMSDIIQRFRDENPELDANVIPDATLMSWLLIGDQEVCMKARLIIQEGVNITAVQGQNTYNLLTLNPLFFDISEQPYGGICQFNTSTSYKRLTKRTKAWLDVNNAQWRIASQGTPRYYYRSGQNIIVYPTPDNTITKFTADIVLLSNPFNNLNIMPYNQLPYLAPFHYALVLYLAWRGKVKVGKDEESDTALKAYAGYVEWMIKTLYGGKFDEIEFRPQGLPSIGFQR